MYNICSNCDAYIEETEEMCLRCVTLDSMEADFQSDWWDWYCVGDVEKENIKDVTISLKE